MTPKQSRFVEEYLVDLNATQAAIRAGYSKDTAQEQGSRLLSNVMVAAEIERARELQADRTKITADRVLAEYAKIGFANMADYMGVTSQGDPFLDLSDLPRDRAAAISEVTTEDYVEGRGEDARTVRKIKMKLHPKLDALTQIGRHLGMFTDKTEHSFDLSKLDDAQLAALKEIVRAATPNA